MSNYEIIQAEIQAKIIILETKRREIQAQIDVLEQK